MVIRLIGEGADRWRSWHRGLRPCRCRWSARRTCPGPQGSGSTDPSRATHGKFAKAMTSLMGRISMNGVPRATARAAKGKRSIGAKVDTVVQPEMDERAALSANHMSIRQRRRLPEICRDHAGRSGVRAALPATSGQSGAALYAATTRQRSCVTRARHLFAWECPSSGTADREPGPDPSEGPQRPSSVSHKTRRTLLLFPAPPAREKNFRGRHGPSFLHCTQKLRIGNEHRQ